MYFWHHTCDCAHVVEGTYVQESNRNQKVGLWKHGWLE